MEIFSKEEIERQYKISLPIAHRVRGYNRIIGTATCIKPGIYLTAGHLLDEWIKDGLIDGIDDDDSSIEKYGIDILHVMPQRKLAVSRIKTVQRAGMTSDIVVLVAEHVDGFGAPILVEDDYVVPINLHQPQNGESVMSLGYGRTQQNGSNFKIFATYSEGPVLEIINEGGRMHSDPTMRCEYQMEQGMSGGPVLDMRGNLVGINSTGLEYLDDKNQTCYDANVSMLWGIMGMSVNLNIGGKTESVTLDQLASRGIIKVEGRDHIKILRDSIRYTDYSKDCDQCT